MFVSLKLYTFSYYYIKNNIKYFKPIGSLIILLGFAIRVIYFIIKNKPWNRTPTNNLQVEQPETHDVEIQHSPPPSPNTLIRMRNIQQEIIEMNNLHYAAVNRPLPNLPSPYSIENVQVCFSML